MTEGFYNKFVQVLGLLIFSSPMPCKYKSIVIHVFHITWTAYFYLISSLMNNIAFLVYWCIHISQTCPIFCHFTEYMCHVYVRADNLAAVLISDHEYPRRVAHTLITKVMDDFEARHPSSTWPTLKEVTTDFPQINTYLAKYQNPVEADALTKMQNDLDETKIILVR